MNAKRDIIGVIACLRYYAGWADKVQGKTIEVGARYLGFKTCAQH